MADYPMADKFTKAREGFDQLPLRTRLAITFAMVLLIWVFFYLFWFASVDSSSQKIEAQMTKNQQQIDTLNQSQQDLHAGVYKQRNNPKRNQLAALVKQTKQLESQLERTTRSLIKPEAMALLLENIIIKSSKLKLQSLTKLQPQALFDPEEASDEAQMYRHSVKLKFEGNYQQTQMFLAELESMQQKVTFDSLDFLVEEYPRSSITLVVSTFSMNRKWIGG